jgi:hypothetical protein
VSTPDAMAAHLEYQVDVLMPWLECQPDERASECLITLLVGLSSAAEAFHAMARDDLRAWEDHMRSAIGNLRRTNLALTTLPDFGRALEGDWG